MKKKSLYNIFLLFGICLPVTIACVDVMAVSVALDNIMADFKSTVSISTWLLSGYTVGTASFLIVIGQLADIYGRRKLLLCGVSLFLIFSLSAAISPSMSFLIISRFGQGVASAMMMTTVIAIITSSFPVSERNTVIAKWGFSLGLGLASGPTIGGILLYIANWRAIFLINIPIALLSYYLIIKFVPESKSDNIKKVDWLETSVLTIFLVSLVFSLSEADIAGVFSFSTEIITAILILFGILLVRIETLKIEPLISSKFFKLHNFSGAVICGAISYFCMYAWLFVFGIYLQKYFGLSALEAGILCSSFSIAFAFSMRLIGFFGKRLSYYSFIRGGFILAFLSFLWMSFITIGTPLAQIGLMFFSLGMSISAINAPSMSIATEYVPKNYSGVVSGIIFSIRWLSGSLGIVITAFIFERYNLSITCIFMAILCAIGFLFSIKKISTERLMVRENLL